MHDGRPSITAERVALRRAVHQVLDAPPVFEDPLALRMVGLDAQTIPRDDAETRDVDRQRRAFVAARSRYVEDELARAIAGAVRQYVILGAGLDTFAYRNPHPDLRVFEVDHPATQAWKREKLEAAGIAIPATVTFAPVDFERDRLHDALTPAGFDRGRPAFFCWLGVVAYLAEDAVADTLRFVASCARRTVVAFDYAVPPTRLDAEQRARFDALAARVAAIGEPWRTFFDPAAIGPYLEGLGFAQVEDLGADDINQRYFGDRRDGLRIAGVGRMAHLARAET